MNDNEYLVILERAPGNWAAYSPDLPGCVTTGATEEETLANMREAIALHIDGMRAEGLPIPPPFSRATYVAVESGRC
jgi:predicted RNase H-like HicB family nuclease